MVVNANATPKRSGSVERFDGTVEQAQPPPSSEKSCCCGGPQVWVPRSHFGSAGDVQSLSLAHCSHFFVCGSQTGVAPEQSELFVQLVPHLWDVGSQMGALGGQSLFESHPTHVWLVGSHTGTSPGHCELLVHVVPHLPALQIGFGALQSALVQHCWQVCESPQQTGAAAGHSALLVQVLTQVFVAGSQTGASPGQSELFVHPTHVLSETSQTGVGETQCVVFVAVHWTQMPSGSLHAGVADVQFASLVQPSVHVSVVVLQMPFTPVQSPFVTHCTHTSCETLQTGVAPVQATPSVASHCTQLPAGAPLLRQAGSAAA
jgi:hypothetical protein